MWGPPGAGAVGIEWGEDDLAFVFGDGIPGDQHAVVGEVDRDAAGCVTWCFDDGGTAGEVQYLPVFRPVVDLARWF